MVGFGWSGGGFRARPCRFVRRACRGSARPGPVRPARLPGLVPIRFVCSCRCSCEQLVDLLRESGERCSSDRRRLTRGRSMSAARNSRATSACNSRSRFLANTVGCQTCASIGSPTNPRNKRLSSICSISIRVVPKARLQRDAHREKRLQKRRAQQMPRRDRRTAHPRTERLEPTIQRGQRLVRQRPDRPQRMIRGDALLEPQIAEQTLVTIIAPAHGDPACFKHSESQSRNAHETLLQQPASGARGGGAGREQRRPAAVRRASLRPAPRTDRRTA